MDELIDTEMGLVEVEQSDRELAADHMFIGGDAKRHACEGRYDKHPYVQAAARHRIAEREAIEDAIVAFPYWMGTQAKADLIAYLRNRTPCTPSPTGVD